MSDHPIKTEGHEPASIAGVRFGRHPADANVNVLVPRFDAAVNFTLAPAVYMNMDFMENYLQYVCVVTSKQLLTSEEAGEAVNEAVQLVEFGHILPTATADKPTAELLIMYSESFPGNPEMEAKGIFTAGLLIVIEADPEAFQQTRTILKMAGLASMAAGRLNEQPETNDDADKPSRRLSDAMPPNRSKH